MSPLCTGLSRSINIINSNKIILAILILSDKLWIGEVYLFEDSDDSLFLF